MPFFENFLKGLPEYHSLFTSIEKNRLPCGVTGVSHIHRAHLITTLCDALHRRAVILVSDEGEGTRLCEDINSMGGDALLFPARDFNFRPSGAASKQYEQERLGVLSKLLEGNYKQVIACTDAAMQYTVSPERLFRRNMTLKEGQAVSPETVCGVLVAGGYTRCDLVEGPGQFARRGGILDLFTTDADEPTRIEFWGDEIDCMGRFDVISQRRTSTVKTLHIPPACEILFDSPEELADQIESVAKRLRSENAKAAKARLLADAEVLRSGGSIGAVDRFLPLIEEIPCTIFDYTADALLFVSETSKVKEKARVFHWQLSEDIKALFEEGVLCRGLDRFAMSFDELTEKYTEQGAIFLDAFARGSFDVPVKELTSFTVKNSTPFSGNINQLYDDIEPLLSRKFAVAVLAGGEKGAKILADDLRSKGLPADYSDTPNDVPYGKIAHIQAVF